MFPETYNRQRGFSLIMGIFLVVVLGGIAVVMGKVATMQYQESTLDETGAIAYQSARAGVEWGVYQILQTSGTFKSNCDGATYASPSSQNITFSAASSMTGFTAKVACGSSSYTEGSSTYRVYQLVATACNSATCPAASPGLVYVERELQVLVRK